MNEKRAKEGKGHQAADRWQQMCPPESIPVFLVLALIILAAGVFSRQRFLPATTSSDPAEPSGTYLWLTDFPDIADGLYFITPKQLAEKPLVRSALLPSKTAIGTETPVRALRYNYSSDRSKTIKLPPKLANIFFLPIPVNRADRDILETLPGIGPVLAKRIVRQREEHGPFKAKEELLQISGIGPKKFAGLVDHITLE